MKDIEDKLLAINRQSIEGIDDRMQSVINHQLNMTMNEVDQKLTLLTLNVTQIRDLLINLQSESSLTEGNVTHSNGILLIGFLIAFTSLIALFMWLQEKLCNTVSRLDVMELNPSF